MRQSESTWPVVAPAAEGRVLPSAETPTFSVIIPAFEAAAFVGDAVTSVFAQTNPALEIIVVDDGSTDDIARVLEPLTDRIVLLRVTHGGTGAAKNHGLERARGEFVTALDADDVFLPRRLEALAHFGRQRPDLDVLTTDANITVAGSFVRRFYSPTHSFPVDDQALEILKRCFLLGNSAARRERLYEIGGFDERLRRAGDWDLWIRLLRSGARAGLIAEPLVEYRQRPASLTSNRAESLRARIAVLEKAQTQVADRSPAYAVLESTLAEVRERVRREDAKAAIIGGEAGRRRSAAVVFGRGTSIGSRLRALLGVASPGLARRALRRRGQL